MSDKQYLGDGVYIEGETGQLRMTAESGGQMNVIYLEPEVMDALIKYYKNLLGVQVL